MVRYLLTAGRDSVMSDHTCTQWVDADTKEEVLLLKARIKELKRENTSLHTTVKEQRRMIHRIHKEITNRN